MAQAERSFDMQIKLLMIGDSGVGKTCLLLRYANDSFSSTFITTIGIDFKIKTINLDGKKIKLQIWDTAGQERFRTISTSYIRGAHGVLLVYDVTDRKSFENIRYWKQQIQHHADRRVNCILVGNKCDLPDKIRAVTYEEGHRLAQCIDEDGNPDGSQKMPFFEASAKNNVNVSEAFITLARAVKERLEKAGTPSAARERGVDLQGKSKSGKSSSCPCSKS